MQAVRSLLSEGRSDRRPRSGRSGRRRAVGSTPVGIRPEKGGPATSATGYFKDLVDNGGKLPYHRPNPTPMGLDETNSGVPDQAGFWDFVGPYKAGSFEWVIPTYYQVRDGGRKHKIKDVVQTCTIGADGTMTVSKGSSRRSRTP